MIDMGDLNWPYPFGESMPVHSQQGVPSLEIGPFLSTLAQNRSSIDGRVVGFRGVAHRFAL